MQNIFARLGSDKLRQWLPLATLVILVAVVGVMQPVFLEPSTLLQLASDTAVLFILATGVTFVIMLGGIDLSIQSMASLASVIVALTVARLGHGAFVLAVAIGALAGLLSGLAHVRLKVPSFIATLAMGGVLFSTALVTSKERSITLGDVDRSYQTWITGTVFGVPNVIIIGLIVLAIAHTLQAHTRFGRYSAAIGGRARRLCIRRQGRPPEGFRLRSLGHFRRTCRCHSCGPPRQRLSHLAAELLLPSIAAVVVGGTAITGGVGSIWRTLVGALIISVVRIGMTFLGVNIFAQNIVFGAVLIAAVAITIDRSKIPIVK